jgi:hypothetical protein
VPDEVVASKLITHPFDDPSAGVPPGWSHVFARRVSGAVLRGASVLTAEGARAAGARLLPYGPVRLKPARTDSGRGQRVAIDAESLAAAIAAIESDSLLNDGLVVEEELGGVSIQSVGRLRVDDLLVSYCGTRRTTTDNSKTAVYGGATLALIRGGFDVLLQQNLPEDAHEAVRQAMAFDTAAGNCFAGFYASRRNYDVAQGTDATGRRRSGVLGACWRIGGASPAEILGIQALAEDPDLKGVTVSCRVVYGIPEPPSDAAVFFASEDPDEGPVLSFAKIDDRRR